MRHVVHFSQHFGRSPAELGPEQIRAYQLHLLQERQASGSVFNQAVCALRFLFHVTLRQPEVALSIPTRRAGGKQPERLDAALAAAYELLGAGSDQPS